MGCRSTSPRGFEYMFVNSTASASTAHNEKALQTRPKAVHLQKEIIVSTTTDDAPRTPDLTGCDDPLGPVQRYKASYHVEQQRYREGQRHKPPTSKEAMPTTRLESYLMTGCCKKSFGEK